MTRFCCLCLLFLAVTTCSAPADAPENTPSPRPNILFILTDDQGIGDLSLHGNDSIRTPVMDSLLLSGARFDRFYVSPVCAPTRASFLSGLHAPRTGAVYVTRRRETMDDGVVTIAEHLREAGYRTGLFGKWHSGATFPYHPGGQGFDEFLGFTLGHFNDYFAGELRDERDRPVSFRGDLTDILTDSATHFMLEGGDEPFFTMLTYQAPHTPVQVADDHWEAVKSRGLTDYNTGIYAMVESIDEQLGRLFARLEAAGKLDNTIVVFSTDNGPNGDRYRMGLKGTKGHVDEGGVRVPFVLRLPDNHPANGQVFSTPAAHIDLLPTLLDYLELGVPDSLDGVSLLPLLNGGTIAQRYIYTFKQGYDFKPYPGSMRNRDFLYVGLGPDQHELYRLDKDPEQRSDLMTTTEDWLEGQREIGREMAATYAKMATTVARPDLIAPPIDLDAAPGPIRLLAHEGESRGDQGYSAKGGWANDYFYNLQGQGGHWPITTEQTREYRITVRYHLEGDKPRTLVLRTDEGDFSSHELPPAISQQIPVADRVKRKEVYPREWREYVIQGWRIKAGSTSLELFAPQEDGLWLKALVLEPLR
ncbi:MAG: sulfatase-like hydrolase/transferase [Bacteroidota bacterium]